MRLHTGEKPYSCSHCDRQFVQVANLRRHLRVHTGERPYTCEVCEARFCDSNQLKTHALTHTSGLEKFECEKCNVKFTRRHQMMQHKCGIPEIDDESNQSLDLSSNPMNLTQEPQLKKFCTFPQFLGLPLQIPEQTEPEDLSVHTPRSNLSNNEEFDEFDDAATMYLKLKQKQLIDKLSGLKNAESIAEMFGK